uniref:BED-type domain-containing protein n=1 Tax=Meloidogyne javanica TaxID=6303 RepID=A0A915MZQ5_MELJA
MSKIWDYFKKEAGVAFCKNCEYTTKFPPQTPTTKLATHLKNKHGELHKELKEKRRQPEEQQLLLSNKRVALQSDAPTSSQEVERERES